MDPGSLPPKLPYSQLFEKEVLDDSDLARIGKHESSFGKKIAIYLENIRNPEREKAEFQKIGLKFVKKLNESRIDSISKQIGVSKEFLESKLGDISKQTVKDYKKNKERYENIESEFREINKNMPGAINLFKKIKVQITKNEDIELIISSYLEIKDKDQNILELCLAMTFRNKDEKATPSAIHENAKSILSLYEKLEKLTPDTRSEVSRELQNCTPERKEELLHLIQNGKLTPPRKKSEPALLKAKAAKLAEAQEKPTVTQQTKPEYVKTEHEINKEKFTSVLSLLCKEPPSAEEKEVFSELAEIGEKMISEQGYRREEIIAGCKAFLEDQKRRNQPFTAPESSLFQDPADTLLPHCLPYLSPLQGWQEVLKTLPPQEKALAEKLETNASFKGPVNKQELEALKAVIKTGCELIETHNYPLEAIAKGCQEYLEDLRDNNQLLKEISAKELMPFCYENLTAMPGWQDEIRKHPLLEQEKPLTELFIKQIDREELLGPVNHEELSALKELVAQGIAIVKKNEYPPEVVAIGLRRFLEEVREERRAIQKPTETQKLIPFCFEGFVEVAAGKSEQPLGLLAQLFNQINNRHIPLTPKGQERLKSLVAISTLPTFAEGKSLDQQSVQLKFIRILGDLGCSSITSLNSHEYDPKDLADAFDEHQKLMFTMMDPQALFLAVEKDPIAAATALISSIINPLMYRPDKHDDYNQKNQAAIQQSLTKIFDSLRRNDTVSALGEQMNQQIADIGFRDVLGMGVEFDIAISTTELRDVAIQEAAAIRSDREALKHPEEYSFFGKFLMGLASSMSTAQKERSDKSVVIKSPLADLLSNFNLIFTGTKYAEKLVNILNSIDLLQPIANKLLTFLLDEQITLLLEEVPRLKEKEKKTISENYQKIGKLKNEISQIKNKENLKENHLKEIEKKEEKIKTYKDEIKKLLDGKNFTADEKNTLEPIQQQLDLITSIHEVSDEVANIATSILKTILKKHKTDQDIGLVKYLRSLSTDPKKTVDERELLDHLLDFSDIAVKELSQYTGISEDFIDALHNLPKQQKATTLEKAQKAPVTATEQKITGKQIANRAIWEKEFNKAVRDKYPDSTSRNLANELAKELNNSFFIEPYNRGQMKEIVKLIGVGSSIIKKNKGAYTTQEVAIGCRRFLEQQKMEGKALSSPAKKESNKLLPFCAEESAPPLKQTESINLPDKKEEPQISTKTALTPNQELWKAKFLEKASSKYDDGYFAHSDNPLARDLAQKVAIQLTDSFFVGSYNEEQMNEMINLIGIGASIASTSQGVYELDEIAIGCRRFFEHQKADGKPLLSPSWFSQRTINDNDRKQLLPFCFEGIVENQAIKNRGKEGVREEKNLESRVVSLFRKVEGRDIPLTKQAKDNLEKLIFTVMTPEFADGRSLIFPGVVSAFPAILRSIGASHVDRLNKNQMPPEAIQMSFLKNTGLLIGKMNMGKAQQAIVKNLPECTKRMAAPVVDVLMKETTEQKRMATKAQISVVVDRLSEEASVKEASNIFTNALSKFKILRAANVDINITTQRATGIARQQAANLKEFIDEKGAIPGPNDEATQNLAAKPLLFAVGALTNAQNQRNKGETNLSPLAEALPELTKKVGILSKALQSSVGKLLLSAVTSFLPSLEPLILPGVTKALDIQIKKLEAEKATLIDPDEIQAIGEKIVLLSFVKTNAKPLFDISVNILVPLLERHDLAKHAGLFDYIATLEDPKVQVDPQKLMRHMLHSTNIVLDEIDEHYSDLIPGLIEALRGLQTVEPK